MGTPHRPHMADQAGGVGPVAPGGFLAHGDWSDRSTSIRRAVRVCLGRWAYLGEPVTLRWVLLRAILQHFRVHRGSVSSERLQNALVREHRALYQAVVGDRRSGGRGRRSWHRFVESAAPVLALTSHAPEWANGETVWRVYLACRDAAVWRAVDGARHDRWALAFHTLEGGQLLADVLRDHRPPRAGLGLVCRAVRRLLCERMDCLDAPAVTTTRRQVLRAVQREPARFRLEVAHRGTGLVGPACAAETADDLDAWDDVDRGCWVSLLVGVDGDGDVGEDGHRHRKSRATDENGDPPNPETQRPVPPEGADGGEDAARTYDQS